MRRSTDASRDVTGAEKRQLAVASATLGPWRPAAAVGAIGGGVSLAASALGGDFGLGVVAGAVSVALMLFFLVGGAGAVTGRGPRADPRLRRWAAAHPWRVALVPAGLLLVADVVMRRILTSEGFFGSVWDGLWRGALVAGVVGVVGSVAGKRRPG
jgi:hypothetical protein